MLKIKQLESGRDRNQALVLVLESLLVTTMLYFCCCFSPFVIYCKCSKTVCCLWCDDDVELEILQDELKKLFI